MIKDRNEFSRTFIAVILMDGAGFENPQPRLAVVGASPGVDSRWPAPIIREPIAEQGGSQMARHFRLGMWNRLAIVLTVILSLGVPTYFHFARGLQLQIDFDKSLQDCKDIAISKGLQLDPAADYIGGCQKQTKMMYAWEEQHEPYMYVRHIVAMFALSVAAYLLIWAGAAVARWILRGRTRA